MTAAGALWGTSWDLESETPSLKRSNAFALVAEECHAVRRDVLLDITGFSRFEVTGIECRVAGPGSGGTYAQAGQGLAPMLMKAA